MRRVVSVLVAASALVGGVASTANATVAPDAPGVTSYFDLARKDCVGTARNTTSKVWFTVAGGVLSDTYWPNVDATNVKTLQYLVTDGHSFTDLQTRDMTYTSVPDRTGMACTVTATNAAHGYRIVTTYLTDPRRDAVLMRTRFVGPSGDQLYVRLDPLAAGTGGGAPSNAGPNSAQLATANGHKVLVVSNTNTTTNAVNRTYAVPTFEALVSSAGFGNASVGYAGSASDGLAMLDATHALTEFNSAPAGHVALTAGLKIPANQAVDLALGFGKTQGDAVATAGASATQPFRHAWSTYTRQWRHYDARLHRPSSSLGPAAVRQYYRSVNVVKASEDKTFPGAIAAGLASPWGQSVPAGNFDPRTGLPTYFGSYREVFARDLYEASTGLLVAGDRATAHDATRFLFDDQQQPDGSMPRNSLLNGKVAPDTGGVQLDEASYPILMDWQSGLASDARLYRDHVIPAADFVVAHGPSDGVERWEEQSGFSPSTIAAEIAGLTAAARIARVNHDPAHAAVYQATADQFARQIKTWTVTTTGPYGPSYFIRVSKTGDPNAAISYGLGNGSVTVDQRSVVDAGFLDLVRLGVLPASDPTVADSLSIIDKVIERQTPNGTGFYRYGVSPDGSEDGYGDCFVPDPTTCATTGAPWAPTSSGSGHLWPVLAGERGEFDVAHGNGSAAATLLGAMAGMTSGRYLEPEQVWENPPVDPSPFGSDPLTASIGFKPGQPVGSASPLTWSEAQYARLAVDLSAGRVLDTPAVVTDRYVRHGMPGTLPVSITSPAPGTPVSTDSVTISGTTAPGATVVVEASQVVGGKADIATTTGDGSGDWSVSLADGFATTTITATATSGRNTGYAQTSVVNLMLPGTPAFAVTDPAGDDNGPGTYAYPTDPSFQPGSFDLTGMTVNQTATDVYIEFSIKNLVPTFGNAFGAQLLDLYVHDPAATSTSTASASSLRNYSIAPADAWNQRIEAQGFASLTWLTAAGPSRSGGQFIVDDPSGTATLILPIAALGTVKSGWVFTVALTGQDGFNPDQSRAFQPTPQAFQFGVCPTSSFPSPICAVNPNSVPRVMDTIAPANFPQVKELDPTLGPVVLHGVAVP